MNAKTMAEWFRRQGHHVVEAAGLYWYDQGPRVYQSFPYHWVLEPVDQDLNLFLLRNMAIGLRYSAPLEAQRGALSYHSVFEDGQYTMQKLPRRARTNVRKGLRNMQVEPISFDRLATDGWTLRAQTLERQGRTGAETEEWWQRLCHSADGLPGFEAWGAFCRGRLVAALLAVTCDACYTMLFQQSATDYLHLGANNVLAYSVTHEVTARPEIESVFYGLHSLDAPPDVDTFKFRMAYVAKPVRQRVMFNPLLMPAFNRYSHGWLQQALERRPDSNFLAKAEGMLRLYLQGQQALEMQPVPAGLDGFAVTSEPERPPVQSYQS